MKSKKKAGKKKAGKKKAGKKKAGKKKAGKKKADAQAGIDALLLRLRALTGYYIWSHILDPDGGAWMYRVPRKDLESAPWLKNEDTQLIHICRSAMMFNALQDDDKERTVAHSGYVKKQKCKRCKEIIPEDLYKKLNVMRMLHKVGKYDG